MTNIFQSVEQLRQHLPASATFDMDRFAPFVQDSYQEHIVPLTGGIELHEASQSVRELAERATARLAYLSYLPFAQVMMDSSGVRIATTDKIKTAFQWQINDIAEELDQTGYVALDRLAERLRVSPSELTGYDGSQAQKDNFLRFVATAHQLTYHIPAVRNNRRTYLQLAGYLQKISDRIRRIISPALYDRLLTSVMLTKVSPADTELVALIRRATCHTAFADAIMELPATLNRNGFVQFTSKTTEARAYEQVADSRLDRIYETHKSEGEAVIEEIQDYMHDNVHYFPEFRKSAAYNPDRKKGLNDGSLNFYVAL